MGEPAGARRNRKGHDRIRLVAQAGIKEFLVRANREGQRSAGLGRAGNWNHFHRRNFAVCLEQKNGDVLAVRVSDIDDRGDAG